MKITRGQVSNDDITLIDSDVEDIIQWVESHEWDIPASLFTNEGWDGTGANEYLIARNIVALGNELTKAWENSARLAELLGDALHKLEEAYPPAPQDVPDLIERAREAIRKAEGG